MASEDSSSEKGGQPVTIIYKSDENNKEAETDSITNEEKEIERESDNESEKSNIDVTAEMEAEKVRLQITTISFTTIIWTVKCLYIRLS